MPFPEMEEPSCMLAYRRIAELGHGRRQPTAAGASVWSVVMFPCLSHLTPHSPGGEPTQARPAVLHKLLSCGPAAWALGMVALVALHFSFLWGEQDESCKNPDRGARFPDHWSHVPFASSSSLRLWYLWESTELGGAAFAVTGHCVNLTCGFASLQSVSDQGGG